MADAIQSTAATEVSANKGAGFPPFDTTTFVGQWFWLVITFGFLFIVLWKVAGPRINGVITARRGAINNDIQAAQKARADAEAAGGAYEAALASARSRANAMAEENRQSLNAQIAKAKADADAQTAGVMAAAQARIAATQKQARGHVAKAAEEAAIAIVARLTGETVSAADAAKAVEKADMEILAEGEFWVAIGFVAVIALLIWKGVPGMVGKMLDQRAAVIAGELNEARRLREEAAALLADYLKRAAGAEAEAQSIITDARAEAERFALESRANLKTQIERRTQAAQDKIAQAEAAAMNEIRALAANAAASAAEKLIIARMDEKRAAALVEESLKDLGGKLN